MTAATAHRTLVLNADYRPISTWPLSLVSAQDALCTVIRDRATVVEEWDAVFRSPTVEIRIPKTIALRSYAPVNAAPKFCRRSILLRDRYRCQFCGERFASEDLTFDHVIPRSEGGKTVWENILSACIPCNARMKNLLPDYSGRGAKRPLKPPKQPTTAELLRAGLEFLDPDIRSDWGSWLYWNAELKS